VADLNTLQPP